jgi:hypothetical protein
MGQILPLKGSSVEVFTTIDPRSNVMVDPQNTSAGDPSAVQARLHEIAELLRKTHHLGPEAQQALAKLADELGKAIGEPRTPLASPLPFVESMAQVVEALHQSEDQGPTDAPRDRLRELAAKVETQAPNATAFARRLLDTLSALGI